MKPYSLYHVVAVARGNVIGKENQLPWHFKSDLQHFKALTLGETVIMGRKTFESLGRKPLPGRENFVLSHSPEMGAKGVKFFASLGEALKKISTPKAFVIGGERLYRQTFGEIDGIYSTQVPGEYEGDAFYPEIPASFRVKERKLLQEDPKVEVIYYERTCKDREGA